MSFALEDDEVEDQVQSTKVIFVVVVSKKRSKLFLLSVSFWYVPLTADLLDHVRGLLLVFAQVYPEPFLFFFPD